mmetsp:Transcript_4375/g.9866  ORF Transcript_4375/g.9866 Transcript_4375/m.9866 type:complete len:379 (+) Transcript_4375:55-1191(+)
MTTFLSLHNPVRSGTKRGKTAAAIILGLAFCSAVLFIPAALDGSSIIAHNKRHGVFGRGSQLQRLLRSEGLLDIETDEPLLYDGRNSICPATNENTIANERKATIVLMSYSPLRLDDVAWVLRCYQKMTGAVEQIIFVWNNLDVELPGDIIPSSDDSNVVPVQLFNPAENLMTNRFDAPSRLVDSSSPVILIDDDVLLTAGLISGMVDYWKSEPCLEQCVVGLDPRYVSPISNNYYLYDRRHTPNVIIGKTMLAANRHFQDFMKRKNLVEHSGPPSNACEDLTFSLFVTTRTGLLPVVVKGEHYTAEIKLNSQKKFLSDQGEFIGSRYDIPEYDGMSAVKGPWVRNRKKCVSWNLGYHGNSLRQLLLSYNQEHEPEPR